MTTDTTTRTPLDGTQRLLAVGLVLGVTLVAFEATAIITALPTITDDLGGDSLYGVTLATYTLANLVALVAAGRYADRNGPLPTFLISIGVFITGLLVRRLHPRWRWWCSAERCKVPARVASPRSPTSS